MPSPDPTGPRAAEAIRSQAHDANAVADSAPDERHARGTEQALAEAQAARARLHTILQHAPGFVMEVDREGRVRYLNRARRVPLEQVVGASWLQRVPVAERPRLEALLSTVLDDGAAVAFEVELPGRDGAASHYAAHMGPLREPASAGAEGGAIVGAIIFAQDVTAQKRAQAELEAAQRLAGVGTLAAGVAHEINNPLSSVIANLSLALGDVRELNGRGVDTGELLAELEDARGGADRIRGIARDLKMLARPRNERTGPVNAEEVFETMLRLAQNEIRHRARVVRDFGDVPAVEAIEARLGQVVLNLLINAAQSLPDGHADENHIRVGTRLAGDGMVCLEVADSGPGISDEVKRKLFTPFFTTKAPGTGSGLGLVICEQIVRSFKGRIEVESAPGQGATFMVFLPVAGTEPRRATPGTFPGAASEAPRRRVLLIDDEPVIGMAVRRILSRTHDVTTSKGVREALALLEAGERYDLILCDVMMPDLSGVDFLDALATQLPGEVGKVVLITGGVFSQRARALVDSGAHPVLEKPFDPQGLRAFVEKRLRARG